MSSSEEISQQTKNPGSFQAASDMYTGNAFNISDGNAHFGAEINQSHCFGDISIAGGAKAHLGNNYTHNTYYISRAVFPKKEKYGNIANRVRKRKLLPDGKFQSSLCDRIDRGLHPRTRGTETLNRDSDSFAPLPRRLQIISDQSTDALLVPDLSEKQTTQQILQEVSALLPSQSNGETGFTPIPVESIAKGLIALIVDNVRQGFQASISPWLSLPPTKSSPSRCVTNTSSTESNSQNQALISVQSDVTKPVQELAALVLFLLLCASYRNLSSKDMSQIATRFQEDRLLPLWTWLLGIGVARYLFVGPFASTLSGLSGDSIVLEDAFQFRRRVSMSICEDYSILKAFLEVHYHGRPGERLVRASKFNLTLNSRRGLVLRRDDWSTKGQIPAGTLVVMSIFLTTDDATCTTCQMSLEVTRLGEFFCQSCNRYYRDCDALQFLTNPSEVFSEQGPVGADNERPAAQPAQRIVEIDSEEEADLKCNIDTLKNIDLRILPHRKKRDVNLAFGSGHRIGELQDSDESDGADNPVSSGGEEGEADVYSKVEDIPDPQEPTRELRTADRSTFGDNPRPGCEEFFLPVDGIDREVIQAEIQRYLGPDDTCKPGTHDDGRRGYIIRAYSLLSRVMIHSLKEYSEKYAREVERAPTRYRSRAPPPTPTSFEKLSGWRRYAYTRPKEKPKPPQSAL